MAAAPENDILPRLDDIQNNIRSIVTALGQPTIAWNDIRVNIDNLRGMIQNIINNPHNHMYVDRLTQMEHAVAEAASAAAHEAASAAAHEALPHDPRIQPDYDDIRGPMQHVQDLIGNLRITIRQHVGGYRKRRTQRKRKRRTHRKRTHRKRTQRNRK